MPAVWGRILRDCDVENPQLRSIEKYSDGMQC